MIVSEIMTMDEAAKYLRISRKHLGNILRGKVQGLPRIRHVKAGRRILILRCALDEWITILSRGASPMNVWPSACDIATSTATAPKRIDRIRNPPNPGCASGECI